jgi:hypothetical protein
MKLIGGLRSASKSNWKDAGIWLVFNLLGSLTPVWFGWFLLTLLSRGPSWADFSRHGEFALYSAAMFAPTFYIILRDLEQPVFPGRLPLGLLTLIGTLIATGFFAAVTTAFLTPEPLLRINQSFLQRGTLGLFAFSAVLAFIATVLDNARFTPDVRRISETQRTNLAKEFDKLGGGK